MSNCSLTPFGGQVPNTGQTAEQNIQDCTNFMNWIVGTFVPEQNALLPTICDISGVAISAGYLGQAIYTDVGDLLANMPAQHTYNNGAVVEFNNRYYRCLLDGSPFVTDGVNVMTGEASAGGYKWKWVELPQRIPQIVANIGIGSSTTAGGQTQRIVTVTVPQTGYYLMTTDITPSVASGALACHYTTNLGSFYAYGAISNGSSQTGIIYLQAGGQLYVNAVGNNNQENYINSGRFTATYIGNQPPMDGVIISA